MLDFDLGKIDLSSSRDCDYDQGLESKFVFIDVDDEEIVPDSFDYLPDFMSFNAYTSMLRIKSRDNSDLGNY
jgi:hypothetical protein